MDDREDHLIKSLAESNAEIARSLYQVHGVVSSVHTRLEAFIQAHASHVHQQELRDESYQERADKHEELLRNTVLKVEAWEAQKRLALSVATFVGGGGMVAILSMVIRAVVAK